MKCKTCKKEMPQDAIYCCYCGKPLRKDKGGVKVPEPQLRSGKYWIYLRKEGVSVTESTAAKCIQKAQAIRAGYVAPSEKRFRQTVGEIVDDYIESKSAVLSPSTLNTYKGARRSMFPSAMDKTPDAVSWQKEINEAAKTMHPKTLANNWHIVTAALKAKDIPVPLNISLPKAPKPEKPWLDYEQIETFMEAIKGKPCEMIALLALHGLRRSEILDLTSADIDLNKNSIRISGAVVRAEGGLVRKDTNKSASSQRTVPIMIPRLAELLEGIEGQLADINPDTPYKEINAICKKHGLPPVGYHGLRRSFCSLAFHLGMNPQTVMQLGGWSDITVVNAVYRKLSLLDKNADVQKMRDFYGMNA